MDIRITNYVQHGQRVLSTECILCQACMHVCLEQALGLSFGVDMGGTELLHARTVPDSAHTQEV